GGGRPCRTPPRRRRRAWFRAAPAPWWPHGPRAAAYVRHLRGDTRTAARRAFQRARATRRAPAGGRRERAGAAVTTRSPSRRKRRREARRRDLALASPRHGRRRRGWSPLA